MPCPTKFVLEHTHTLGISERGHNSAYTNNGILELQVLLLAVRTCLVLFRLFGSPDSVSFFSELIM